MTQTQFVLDSSVIIKWLNRINEEDLDRSDRLLDKFEKGKITVTVPMLVKFEIGNALLKGKKLVIPEALDALDAFYKLPLQFVDLEVSSAKSIYEIAYSYDMTYYDATFIHLSQLLDYPLITANPGHQKKFPGVKVIPLKDYK